MGKNVLPFTDQNGYYEVRLESIGGLGANLTGKLLAELGALYMGLNASSFSSYGSEKKGSPVRSYIRFMEKDGEILRNAPVDHPHLLGIFHEAMAKRYPVFAGLEKNSVVVINTQRSAWELQDVARVICIDAAGIARKKGCRLNMVMLGALVRASGFLDVEKLKKLCCDTLGKKYPAQLEANLTGIQCGYDAVMKADSGKENSKPHCVQKKKAENVENLPQSPAGCGLVSMEEPFSGGYFHTEGGVNICPGNTVENDLSASREGFFPAFHPEKCIHCGLCDSTCPDMVFRFSKEVQNGKEVLVNQGPVYQYCKGCLRCVQICPVQALTAAREDGV